MNQESYLFKALITYIKAKTPFRLGQRGICVDFRWDKYNKTWIVRIPRACVSLVANELEFDDCNNMILKGYGMISLDDYESIKPLEERI